MSLGIELHADDLGSSLPCSLGIFDCYDAGTLHGASVMVTRPEVLEGLVQELARRPGLELALHLNLTEGRPVAPAARLDLLCRGGVFRHSLLSMLRLYLVSSARTRARLKEQIGREILAQVERFRELSRGLGRILPGVLLDSHEHLHFLPFVRAQLSLLGEPDSLHWRREPVSLTYFQGLGDSRHCRNRLTQMGLNLLLRRTDRAITHRQLWTGTVDPQILMAAPRGVEVLLHPSRPIRQQDLSPDLQPRQRIAYLSPLRAREHQALLSYAQRLNEGRGGFS